MVGTIPIYFFPGVIFVLCRHYRGLYCCYRFRDGNKKKKTKIRTPYSHVYFVETEKIDFGRHDE